MLTAPHEQVTQSSCVSSSKKIPVFGSGVTGTRCSTRQGLGRDAPQACWQPEAGPSDWSDPWALRHSVQGAPPGLPRFLTCFQWPGGSALWACTGPHHNGMSQLLASPLTLFVSTSILRGWGGQMLIASSALFMADTGAQGNSSEELSCHWAGPEQGSQTAVWCDFCNPSPSQVKHKSLVLLWLDSWFPWYPWWLQTSEVPSLCRCFHPCPKADRLTSGNNDERRSIWATAPWSHTVKIRTWKRNLITSQSGYEGQTLRESRYECEEGVSLHHSQDTRDRPSRVLQVRSFLLQSILHPMGRQFLYKLNFSVLLPTWIFSDFLVCYTQA